MRIAIICIALFCHFLPLKAQQNENTRKEIVAVVDSFFAAMHRGDSSAMRKVLGPDMILKTVGAGKVHTEEVQGFINAIAEKPRQNEWFEKLWTYELKIDGDLATAWTEYSFFVDKNLSHCGVNHFVITKTKDLGWRIIYIIDTRRKDNCLQKEDIQTVERRAIDSLLNRWHRAAATADEAVFFDSSMTKDAIYLGTDISERWLRDELKSWAKSAFDREVAWAFTASNRQIYFNENDPSLAWMEESLDTWMGPCRGSAVLMKIDGRWKIKHYNLAVAVANDVVEKYMKLIGKKRKK
jgi:hypothetical protein